MTPVLSLMTCLILKILNAVGMIDDACFGNDDVFNIIIKILNVVGMLAVALVNNDVFDT